MEIPLDFTPVRFASRDLPARDRVLAWRDYYGPSVNRADLEPAADVPFRADVTLRRLPGFGLTTTRSSPARYARTPPFLADGRDNFGLHLSFAGGACGQRGREIACSGGNAILMTVAETGWIASSSTMAFWGLWFPRADLGPLVTSLEDRVLQPIASDTEPMRHLISYVRQLEDQTLADPALARIVAVHLRDLFVLALGTTRDMAAHARERGLRAARLQAIKRHIADNLGEHGLTVSAVATHHGLTPRYVQRLFECEGTTFSEYVLSQRLECAFRMLGNAGYAGWSISAIALEAGFGDVSYFNRRFRRRFGMSPSERRAEIPSLEA